MTDTALQARGLEASVLPFDWHSEGACEIRVVPEDSGYYGYVPRLPGAVSQGDTEEECLRNVQEALGAILKSYEEDGEPVPWLDQAAPPTTREKRYWISVDDG